MESDRDCVRNGLFGVKACPHRFYGEWSKVKDIISGLLEILCEHQEDGLCRDLLITGESRVTQL